MGDSSKMVMSGAKRRKSIFRTVVLGTLAIVSIIYGLYEVWEVPLEQVIVVCIASVMIVVGIATLAFLFVGGLHLLRRLFKR